MPWKHNFKAITDKYVIGFIQEKPNIFEWTTSTIKGKITKVIEDDVNCYFIIPQRHFIAKVEIPKLNKEGKPNEILLQLLSYKFSLEQWISITINTKTKYNPSLSFDINVVLKTTYSQENSSDKTVINKGIKIDYPETEQKQIFFIEDRIADLQNS